MASSRRALGEISGSVTMLLVTMALLAGASVISVLSIRGAATLASRSANAEALRIGQLIEVVSMQSNSSGSYIWLYNYGWVDARISSVYANGASVTWTSCDTIAHGSLCALILPAGARGVITVVFGDGSIAVTL